MLSNEQKHKIVEKFGWTRITGWIMEYEKDSDNSSVIVTVEDFERFKTDEPKAWYWNNGYDYSVELDDALEYVYNDYCDDNDLDISFEEFESLVEVLNGN